MKVLVTGGTGFLGRHVCERLTYCGIEHEAVGSGADLTSAAIAEQLVANRKPEVVIHLAATVGGIGLNRARPADLWRDNLLMGVNILEACRTAEVKRLVLVGTTCSYPRYPRHVPFMEEDLFDGYPDETNAPYGIAKRALFVGAMAYRTQYGLDVLMLIPTNLYGPGDHYETERSHVIPAMIRKFHEAKLSDAPTVTLWGTGKVTRDFLHARDCARAIADATMRPLGSIAPHPINLGSGKEIHLQDLATKIKAVVGFKGGILWDTSMPDGQTRRCLDSTCAESVLGWRPEIGFDDGLRETYKDYLERVCPMSGC